MNQTQVGIILQEINDEIKSGHIEKAVIDSHVGRVRFFGTAKKRNPTTVFEIKVGLRYRATLDKLTRPTTYSAKVVGLRYRATLDKLTRPTTLTIK